MAPSHVRPPAVAGEFYHAEEHRLRRQLERCFFASGGPKQLPHKNAAPLQGVVGVLMPHAAYQYSGPTAARAAHALAARGVPEEVVILGPNHQGVGPGLALPEAMAWDTPLGRVRINMTLAQELLPLVQGLDRSDAAHRGEHSLEVIVPFLQYLYGPELRILPVAMADQELATSVALGTALAQVLKERRAVIVASADLSHYLPESLARRRDTLAMKALTTLDPQEFLRVVNDEGVSTCGPGPVMAMMTACHTLGATQAQALGYDTSGRFMGDYVLVTGYGAALVTRESALEEPDPA